MILKIGGMSCGGCAKSIERALGDLAGVAAVNVDWAEAKAQIRFDENQTSLAALIATIEDAGFDVVQ
ncbi:MAG: heavy-metal-associated domain-containing protein [Neisseria sp.]|nr:heavy-metal-associated domain-containing protein [Neisseria sp.]